MTSKGIIFLTLTTLLSEEYEVPYVHTALVCTTIVDKQAFKISYNIYTKIFLMLSS
jgi:hypothetical protein